MIRTILRSSALLACLFSLPTTGFSQAKGDNPTEESQFWNEVQIYLRINSQTDLVLLGVLRMGANFSGFLRPIDERAGGGIAFKVNKHLTFMPTYIYISQQPTPFRKNTEHRLIANVTGKFSAGQFNFTDRNLIERRVRHSLSDFVMYRNRLQIDHPVRVGEQSFRIYIADEAWYSSLADSWIRNRISIGMFKQFTSHFYAELFYLRQNDGRARPGDVQAIGTLFKITL